jgi:hypothetical protein
MGVVARLLISANVSANAQVSEMGAAFVEITAEDLEERVIFTRSAAFFGEHNNVIYHRFKHLRCWQGPWNS